MAAQNLIAHLAAWYIPTGRQTVSGMEGLTVDGGYLCEAQRMHTELERRARGQPLAVEIDIRPVRSQRTLEQNRLMWALLNKLAEAMNGGTQGSITAEAVYLDMLAEYGSEVDYLQIPIKAVPAIKRAYRVVQVTEMLGDGKCIVRAGTGSSCFTREQMREFINRIFDRLSELGVDDAETTQQYRDWRRSDGLH